MKITGELHTHLFSEINNGDVFVNRGVVYIKTKLYNSNNSVELPTGDFAFFPHNCPISFYPNAELILNNLAEAKIFEKQKAALKEPIIKQVREEKSVVFPKSSTEIRFLLENCPIHNNDSLKLIIRSEGFLNGHFEIVITSKEIKNPDMIKHILKHLSVDYNRGIIELSFVDAMQENYRVFTTYEYKEF